MRLIRFERRDDKSGRVYLGAHLPEKDAVVNLTELLKAPSTLTMRQFLEQGDTALNAAKQAIASGKGRIAMKDIRLKAPIHDSEKVLCIGMNYRDHCTEQNIPVPVEPVVFCKFANALHDPDADLEKDETEKLDWEVELTIVIGKAGKHITRENAMQHVAGYTVVNDVSARDWQLERNGGQWFLGKARDGYAPIGPSIVTPDELGDAHNLGIRCFVNGKAVQNSNTNELIHRTNDVVYWVSRFMTLKPGDLIMTGTPPGVGCFRKPPVFLKVGDVVTVEVDKIGAVTNKIVAPKPVAKL